MSEAHSELIASLRRHLSAVALVKLPHAASRDALQLQLERFGPVRGRVLPGWTEVKEYLCPLKSFPTRYVGIQLGSWTAIIHDMYREDAYVDVLAISRATGCRAVAAVWSEDARHWLVADNGRELRAVVLTHEESGRWVFHQIGEPQPFEDTAPYSAARGGRRLTPEGVLGYLRSDTGLTFPPEWVESSQCYWGLERSVQDLKEPVRRFTTVDGG